MTDRERIEALLRRQKPDRVPIWPFAYDGFAVVYAKASISYAYNNPEVSLAAQQNARCEDGWVSSPQKGNNLPTADIFGSLMGGASERGQ